MRRCLLNKSPLLVDITREAIQYVRVSHFLQKTFVANATSKSWMRSVKTSKHSNSCSIHSRLLVFRPHIIFQLRKTVSMPRSESAGLLFKPLQTTIRFKIGTHRNQSVNQTWKVIGVALVIPTVYCPQQFKRFIRECLGHRGLDNDVNAIIFISPQLKLFPELG